MIAADRIVYLDNNATTQLDPAALEEMLPFLATYYGNPSSAYGFGAQVRTAIERARAQVATLVGCEPAEIVFTSCGTESTNTAIHSALQLDPTRQHIVTTAVEHSATLRYCEQLAKTGCAVTFLGVDGNGRLDLDELERAIRPDTALITTMWANNETGVLFPIEQIAEIARRHRVLFHTDAVQAAGKIPIELRAVPINFCSLSAHKLHGPKGVGALYVNGRSAFRPLLIGGGQEEGRRAGTENVASIVGFGKAAERAAASLPVDQPRVRVLRDRFETTLLADMPETHVNGDRIARLPNTSSLSFAGVDSEAALLLLDRTGVCCSAGSACRAGSTETSHVLRAMHLPDERIRGALRFSFGRFNTDTDVDAAVTRVSAAIRKLRAMAPAPPL